MLKVNQLHGFWARQRGAHFPPIDVYVGTLTAPNATGDYSITDPPFTPELVLAFNTSYNTAGSVINSALTLGAGVDASNRICAATFAHRITPQETSHVTKDDYFFSHTLLASDTASDRFDLVSMDANGFTVTYPNNISGEQAVYMALGNCSPVVGSFNLGTSVGAQAITGLGGQPTLLILYTSAPNVTQTGAAGGYFSFGAATDPSHRFNQAYRNFDVTLPSQVKEYFTDSHLFTEINNTVVVAQADLASMDSDGFTLDIEVTDGTARVINYIALCDPTLDAAVGRSSIKTSTGNQSYSGVGFTPKALIFIGSRQNAASIDTVGAPLGSGDLTLGFAASASQQGAGGFSSGSGVGGGFFSPSAEGCDLSSINCMLMMNDATTVFVAAEFVSMDIDGWTMNFTTVDGQARQFNWIALA